jgi:hypothetical protein
MKLINEPEGKAIITTKYVVENNSTIISIYYDEDGDWQFFGSEDVTEKDAFIISVKQILNIDRTLKYMPDIKPGQTIIRKNINSPWKIM